MTERETARATLEVSDASLRTALDTMLEGVVVTSALRDDDGRIADFRIEYANASVGRISGVAPADQIGQTLLELFPAHCDNGLFESYVRVVETGVPFESGSFRYLDPAAAGGPLDQVLEHRVTRFEDGYVLSVRDVTVQDRADLEIRRLATAIEQSTDSVVITDTAGATEYVNPAFEHVSGYTRDEVLGKDLSILKSGVHGPAFFAAMWATLASGNTFVGNLTSRHKNGSHFEEEAVISPVRDTNGTVTCYVAVNRNLTRERAAEAEQERMTRERAQIAMALADLHILPTAAATAEAVCRQVVRLAGATAARLLYFNLDGAAIPLAWVRADGMPAPLRCMPVGRSRILRQRASEGPWVEARGRRPRHPLDKVVPDLGVQAVAFAPIRQGGQLIGVLATTLVHEDAVAQLTSSLPALLEFAAVAGALVGPAITDLSETGRSRERIADIIKASAFGPVFQPIIDLETGAHAGYEALTRFSNGTAPDVVFDDARATGQAVKLELATLASAISAAAALPQDAWLSLNVSPDLVLANGRLAGVLSRADRPIVLEITEHAPVSDYSALRAAVARLRPRVRLAVDDAGVGVANFDHIVELRPAFVKLDISLVRGMDQDLSRQALMVGLLHFARESNGQMIAEGVETEDELAMLRRLGVPLAQGHLLARPAPAVDWVERSG